jgi:hypothetical protein
MYKWLFHTLDSLTKENVNTQILRRQTKIYTDETNMLLEITLKKAAQKMNEKFSSIRVSHGMRVP